MASSTYVHVHHLGASLTRRVIDETIHAGIVRIGYSKATVYQQKAVREFVVGKDVFVCLPTGSGKSLCFVALPFVFDTLRQR